MELFDDWRIERWLGREFGPAMLERFHALSHPAHRIDLWRYALLWMRGGVYLDIKTTLVRPLELTFQRNTSLPSFFGVVGSHDFMGDRFHNGVLATSARNPLLFRLLQHLLGTDVGLAKPRTLILGYMQTRLLS